MSTITKKITLDVSEPNRIPGIPAKQYDTDSRFLNITLTNEGKPLKIGSEATVRINARRADGKAASFVGTAETDGTVTVLLTPWMLALPDNVCCDISIHDADDTVLSTMNFTLCVEHSNYSEYDPVPDTPGVFHA
ncbi:MAG: phage baseplate upper protein, partial [Roseburia sp.]|nr:phage baseplate upper protein [Roseburia sp.]